MTAAAPPKPPHPVAVFRALKTAWRNYLSGGNAMNLDIAVIPTTAHTAAVPFNGTLAFNLSVPIGLVATLIQSSATKGTVTPVIVRTSPTTGTYSGSFPANLIAAGTATVRVSGVSPGAQDTVTSAVFTVT